MKKKFSQKNRGPASRRQANANRGGFTLVETLVAILIFSISILSILSILASSIGDTTYAKDRIIAGYLAQEGIEYVRNIRDNYVLYPSIGGWSGSSSFVAKMTPCTANNKCGFSATTPTTPTNSISFFNCTADSLHCALYLTNGVYNDSLGSVNSGFTREVWMATTTNPNEVKIFSEVDYHQGSGTANIIFSEDLFNWEP
jgi:type II secretory pathway pseudopilin PulG